MASLATGLRHLTCQRQFLGSHWRRLAASSPRTAGPSRSMSTETTSISTVAEANELADSVRIPFQGVKHARCVPATPSYFTREPKFNDLYIRFSTLLSRHRHLPIVPKHESPQIPWMRLEQIRQHLGEPVKASHFAKVLRLAKRLNQIEPGMAPEEIKEALQGFSRDIDASLNIPRPVTIDKFGRAVGAGRRKEASARAYVVEGTGEVLVNGKPLSEAFGRVHDRESAVWALTATGRMDKYNVWALVEGGGTTGQAEALTLAVAKALVAHEPALKTALRRAGCITRDSRTVERKKPGHLKARKMPAWVKR
ncbi:37S ribosomal protein S9 [Hirsutella minnesotensis 3608]|uniref:Small ribosomal subunit protein uS9m n=1 Tax=Hirsutella minnesotensis 3608 TaxID=1043627 RepID=A0A0F7ZPI9_9HYPO|nr:37S ribosomal protein S9 [Hirsutella minnesotensis 3608]